MATLGGDALTLRPQWYTYALVEGRAGLQILAGFRAAKNDCVHFGDVSRYVLTLMSIEYC